MHTHVFQVGLTFGPDSQNLIPSPGRPAVSGEVIPIAVTRMAVVTPNFYWPVKKLAFPNRNLIVNSHIFEAVCPLPQKVPIVYQTTG